MGTKQYSYEVVKAILNFPYFVLDKETKGNSYEYKKEMLKIKQHYIDYKKGADFVMSGSGGDYIPSNIRFKKAKTLIDKEARFMFSKTPDIMIKAIDTEEEQKKHAEQYQQLVDKVLEKSNFSRDLLRSAKDCFIGGRVACLVDYSETEGIKTHFYNALNFYYETEYGSDKLIKFISFENVKKSKNRNNNVYLVNRYEEINGTVYMSSIVYTGGAEVIETLIEHHKTNLPYIPAVVIVNDGTLEDEQGVSEIESLVEYESGYSKLSNNDIDCEQKGMNPIRYVVDMNSSTTKNLSSRAGSFWELKSEQNQNENKPMIGTLAPEMTHTESVKTTLDRIENAMYAEIDVPNISKETLNGTITSGKTLEALYFPLQVRCDEKLKVWKPAIVFITETIIKFAMLNKKQVMVLYKLSQLAELKYNIEVLENYALMSDEETEKNSDLSEIAANARSRKSYMKKWRGSELKTDAQIEEELMQIAIENNMFDSMSMNTQVQGELSRRTAEQTIEEV